MVDSGGGKMGMMSDPLHQARIHRGQGSAEGGARDSSFGSLHLGPPRCNIYATARASIPADQGAMGDGAKRWVEELLARQVGEDAGEGSEAADEGGVAAHGEGFTGAMLKQLQEGEGDVAWGSRAGVSVLHNEVEETGTQPLLAGFATGGNNGRGRRRRGVHLGFHLEAAEGGDRQLPLRGEEAGE